MANVDVSNNLERHVARWTFPLLARTRACRNLFGPVDHEELHCEMKRKLQEISEQDQSRWNFNFESNSPLPGDYEWEEMSEDSLPCFYKNKLQNKRERAAVSVNATEDASATVDCGFHGLSRSPVQELADVPSKSSELNQENLSCAINSRPARSSVVRNRRKRTLIPESTRNSTPQITDFFPKRKRIIESKLDERTSLQAITSSSLEVTPRKTIR
ncbi:cyclin dependent kinase inhibitor 1Ca [Triplophysa rosa]|uniref:Cyclin-dependent kinase inhibitor 1C n=1 Tax=Triplophysa rosa TaxID=992332 RepID=A0A9W8CC64_TRIRA|nr:cyclin dependent kinase inhibitor 1Ca [Triplophysa rosa]KAI7814825.1 cyclin-dependent kinase inhibitor 1C [Triplophysa rosa]